MGENERSSNEGTESGGRVVYSRLGAAEDDDETRPKGGDSHAAAPGGRREPVWQALVPLLVGFALLIGLVFGLGTLSVQKLRTVSGDTLSDEQRLSGVLNRLLTLRLALDKLNAEARIRAQVEAGTQGGMLPPIDLGLRNARTAVEQLLPLYDSLPLRETEKKAQIRRGIIDYVEITKDPNSYSLAGFSAYRDLEASLKGLSEEASGERDKLQQQRYDALARAQSEIDFLKWLAVLTGLLVAMATSLEVLRRLRQIRRSVDALRRERQYTSQMVEGMVPAIAALDVNDRIRSANAAFFEVFPEARLGGSVHDRFASPEAAKMLAAATGKRVERATYHGRWQLPDKHGGEERAFDVYSSPLVVDGEGGELLTLVDVTEAARAEQELRRQEALAAVGQAAAQVAHEIKNPLGSIRLGVAMLRDMTREREAITTIDLVERGIEHLSKLTLDVTQFSRRKQLALSETELHELLDSSLDLVSDKVQEKHATIERHFSDGPFRAEWDTDQLRQVFVNLFANALDASPDNSSVVISTERVSSGSGSRHNGEGAAPSAFARVTIKDSGSGMDAATRARIFEPFFTTKKRGTGLGLSIAKQIIEQHGGSIGVASTPGAGTSFVVELPLP